MPIMMMWHYNHSDHRKEQSKMTCQTEQNIFDNAIERLQQLWDDLHKANPANRALIASITKKIETQNTVVDNASAALDTCIHKNDVASTNVAATMDVLFRSTNSAAFFNEHNISRVFNFTGPAAARRYTVNQGIVITRTAVTTISGIAGNFTPNTGVMQMAAAVHVNLLGLMNWNTSVTLTTGATRSPTGKFNDTGSPVDSKHRFTLVGSGRIVSSIGSIEYLMKVMGEFHSAPG
jgi:hypothetical protein